MERMKSKTARSRGFSSMRLCVFLPALLALIVTAQFAQAGISRIWAVDDGEKVKETVNNHPLATGSDNPVRDGSEVSLFGAKNEVSADEDGRFVVLPVENPHYRGNELFRAFENYYSPRVRELRNRYGLDAVVAGETHEWKRILLLRHWIKSSIAIDNENPTKTRGDTFAILDAALRGGKFHCAHFSIVQHAVLNSFGYVTRRLGCGPGLKDDGGHHGVNEVWVNKFSKWVLIDAKYDVHFEKNKVPLSALEIRDEVWRDGAQSVVGVIGPGRRPMAPDPETGKWETRPDTYRWCSWETSTNRFTTFPATSTSTLIMLQDEIFKKNTWYRDDKPHWAYDTPYMMLTTRRDWIEWTPNVITSKVTIEDGKARVFLSSCTPNFRSFQIKCGNGTWSDCGEEVELPLAKKDRNRFTFRTINLFGVAGPKHRVEITYTLRKGRSHENDDR